MSLSDDDLQDATDFAVPDEPKLSKHVATAKPRPPLTEEQWANMDKPKVLIVGAGIGGLMLGQLLHKGGIPFEIFERAKEVKPLGSALSLGVNVTTLFKQLGIFDELVKIGKPNRGFSVYFDDKLSYTMDLSSRIEMCDAEEYIVSRPELYELLLRQVPKENIHMNKKVLNFLQNDLGTMIRCHDGTSYHGDILVGADGAYSAVRQHLYKVLKEKNLLPKVDDVPLPFDTVCLVGQTEVLDPEKFPELKLPLSHFRVLLGKNDYLVAIFTTKSDKICWMVVQFLNNNTAKDNDAFRNSEWGPEAAEIMCKEVQHLKIPYGKDPNLTLGDLIDLTPKDLISKVMLEEIVFETWSGGRTVLLGDGTCVLSPNAGQGAISAIHDAVTLANLICSLETKTMPEFNRIFGEYRGERRPIVVHANSASKTLKKGAANNMTGAPIRFVQRHMPNWLLKNILKKSVLVRPQASFLPLVEDNGTAPLLAQPSLVTTLPIIQARIQREKAAEAKAKTGLDAAQPSATEEITNAAVAV
ncbi:hypothetical protein BG004_006102 [Podila humilis]|nr:hypothetical protein BG004_006102 [Podila humilis]